MALQVSPHMPVRSPGRRRTIPLRVLPIPHECPLPVRLRALSRSRWFHSLDERQLRALDERMTRCSWGAGETFFRAGEGADALYIIAEGRVRLSQRAADGTERATDILGPSMPLGAVGVGRRTVQRETAEALVDTCALRIEQAVFHQILLEHPTVAVRVVEAVTDRLSQLQNETGGWMTRPVAARLAAVLLRLSVRLGRDRGHRGILLDVPLCRADLAGLTGSTPESVSRVLSRWKEEAIIDSGRRWVALLDVEHLRRTAAEGWDGAVAVGDEPRLRSS